MTTHSSILAWRIPWTEEPGGLQFRGSQRVRHAWNDLAHMHVRLTFMYFGICEARDSGQTYQGIVSAISKTRWSECWQWSVRVKLCRCCLHCWDKFLNLGSDPWVPSFFRDILEWSGDQQLSSTFHHNVTVIFLAKTVHKGRALRYPWVAR